MRSSCLRNVSISSNLDVFGDTSAACAALAKKDTALARAIDAIERPYIRQRPGGFEALFRIIVEQQVSVASAQAIWGRCQSGMKAMTPKAALRQGEEGLRGFRTFGAENPLCARARGGGCGWRP